MHRVVVSSGGIGLVVSGGGIGLDRVGEVDARHVVDAVGSREVNFTATRDDFGRY